MAVANNRVPGKKIKSYLKSSARRVAHLLRLSLSSGARLAAGALPTRGLSLTARHRESWIEESKDVWLESRKCDDDTRANMERIRDGNAGARNAMLGPVLMLTVRC